MSDDPPAPRKRRRWLRWTLYVLAALGLAVFLLFRDEALDPADDLMPKVEDVAWDETNGWKRMLDRQKRYPVTGWSETRRMDEVVSMEAELRREDLQKLILPETELGEMETIAALPPVASSIPSGPVKGRNCRRT